MHHEMLTQRAPFCDGKKGHAESAFRDACPTLWATQGQARQLMSGFSRNKLVCDFSRNPLKFQGTWNLCYRGLQKGK